MMRTILTAVVVVLLASCANPTALHVERDQSPPQNLEAKIDHLADGWKLTGEAIDLAKEEQAILRAYYEETKLFFPGASKIVEEEMRTLERKKKALRAKHKKWQDTRILRDGKGQ